MMQEEEEKLSKSGRENEVEGMCRRKGKVVMRWCVCVGGCVSVCICVCVHTKSARERERES